MVLRFNLPIEVNNGGVVVETRSTQSFNIGLQTTPYITVEDGSGAAYNNGLDDSGHADGGEHGAPDNNQSKGIQPESHIYMQNKIYQQSVQQISHKRQGSIFNFSVSNLPSNVIVAAGDEHRDKDKDTSQLGIAGYSRSLNIPGEPEFIMSPDTMGISQNINPGLQRDQGHIAKYQSERDRDTAMGLKIFNLASNSALEHKSSDLMKPGQLKNNYSGFQESTTDLNNKGLLAIKDRQPSLDLPVYSSSESTEVNKESRELMRRMEMDRGRIGRRKMFDPG